MENDMKYNLDGNMAALRQHENEMADADAREEAITEISYTFINDIVSAIQCVMQNEIGLRLSDQAVEDILMNTNGTAFLEELAEFVLEKKGEEHESC
jgi:hypothetical protein